MINFGETHSAIEPEPLKIDEYHVTVNTNVHSEIKTDSESGELYTEWIFNSIQYDKDEYIREIQMQQSNKINEIEQALENNLKSTFDGLKDIFSHEDPIPLLFPMSVIPNAFYKGEDGILYVGVAKGIVTRENIKEMLEPDELIEGW